MSDYRQDDDHWWVSLSLPEGGVNITLTTYHENFKPGTTAIYFATTDISSSHKELSNKGAKLNDIKNDLYGTRFCVKWFNIRNDPDNNDTHSTGIIFFVSFPKSEFGKGNFQKLALLDFQSSTLRKKRLSQKAENY